MRILTCLDAGTHPGPEDDVSATGWLLETGEALGRRRADRIFDKYINIVRNIVGFPLDAALLSTAEHLAPFNTASGVSFLFPQLALQAAGLAARRDLVVLAASLISLNNADYPRGFYAPFGFGPEGRDRLNLKPRSLPTRSPLTLLGPCRLAELRSGASGGRAAADFFRAYPWLEPLFEADRPWDSYADQLAGIMEAITGPWFTGHDVGAVRVFACEDVARLALIRLIEDGDECVMAILFDAEGRARLRAALAGVDGAGGERGGTSWFWGVVQGRGGPRKVAVHEADGWLVGPGLRLEWSPGSIVGALRSRQLWPGILLSLFCVSWLPGLPVGGGSRQRRYWPEMARALDDALPGRRRGPLSVFNHHRLPFGSLTLRPSLPWTLPSRGTGLALASGVDPGHVVAQFDRIEAAPDGTLQLRDDASRCAR
jgi:hypothetical protein